MTYLLLVLQYDHHRLHRVAVGREGRGGAWGVTGVRRDDVPPSGPPVRSPSFPSCCSWTGGEGRSVGGDRGKGR